MAVTNKKPKQYVIIDNKGNMSTRFAKGPEELHKQLKDVWDNEFFANSSTVEEFLEDISVHVLGKSIPLEAEYEFQVKALGAK